MITINWETIVIIILIVVILYYLVLSSIYYKREWGDRNAERIKSTDPADPTPSHPAKKRVWMIREEDTSPKETLEKIGQDNPPPRKSDNDNFSEMENEMESEEQLKANAEFDELEAFVEKIKLIFLTVHTEITHDELIAKIRSEIQQYPNLNIQPYRVAIANYVQREAYTKCNLEIDFEEINNLWPFEEDEDDE